MAEPETLAGLISTNLPDNTSNLITPANVRLVFNYVKDNYAPNSTVSGFATEAYVSANYLSLTDAEDYLSVTEQDVLPAATHFVLYDSDLQIFGLMDTIDGGIY